MFQEINQQELSNMESRYRARLVNSLSGFKSANLIGTQDQNNVANLAIVSSVFHLGADPALVGMIIRPNSVPRDTLSNLKETGIYTINQVNQSIWKQAHQSSARYPQDTSEFEHVGLTPEYLTGIDAPFVKESRLKFAVSTCEVQTLAINGTHLVIGEIKHILLERNALQSDGFIDIESLDTVAVSGLDSYHSTQALGRLHYAKPDSFSQLLSIPKQ